MGPKTVIVAALLLFCGMHCTSGAPVASQQEAAGSRPRNNQDDNAPTSPPTTSAATDTTTTTTQLTIRTRPTRRPPPSTDNPEVQPQQEGEGSLQATAEGTKLSALEATQAAVIMNRYLLTEYLHSNPPAMPPCFIAEREPGQLDQHHNPAVDYQQKLKEDYESLERYKSYWDYVEQKNSTDTTLGYQTRFMAVRTRNNVLLNSMKTLFQAANITIPDSTVSGDGAGEEREEGELSPLFPEHCYDTSYEQQARSYLRYQTLTSQYITNDIDGVLQQKASN